jgi:hypothetical protein
MRSGLYLLAVVGGLCFVASLLGHLYRRWRELTERERFVLGMKSASTPGQLRPENDGRLKMLRSPWWAIWRWLPDLWRQLS